MVERLKNPLDEVRKLYDSIPRRIDAIHRLEEDQSILNKVSMNLASVPSILSNLYPVYIYIYFAILSSFYIHLLC